MFALIDIVKYLTIISYLGILVSTLTGFSDLNDNFDFFKMMVAITIFIHTISTLFVEYINKNKDEMKIIHFARSYNLFILSMLVLGIISCWNWIWRIWFNWHSLIFLWLFLTVIMTMSHK